MYLMCTMLTGPLNKVRYLKMRKKYKKKRAYKIRRSEATPFKPQRELKTFANSYVDELLRRSVVTKPRQTKIRLTEIEDRRKTKTVHLDARTVSGRRAKISIKRYKKNKWLPGRQTKARIAFEDPKKTIICIRRRKRRQALFSLGKVGKGKKIRTRKRYNEFSEIKC